MNKWICDERVGAVAVYRGPQVHCFSGLPRTAYYGGGKYDGASWVVSKYRLRWARFLCAVLNAVTPGGGRA